VSGSAPVAEVLGGRYELHEPIGRGGMSTVYRAFDRALGRPVAVKVVRHEEMPRREIEHLRERFRREAAAVASIPPHPNVVQIFDFGVDEHGDRDFIVMELLAGEDLRSVLRERRPALDEAVRILIGAARGVAAGHRAGVVHRDVKPANLLLVPGEGGDTVRVVDFGIAKTMAGDDDDLTRTAGVPLTPAYASPEQLSGTGPPGPASDVYQLGLVGYELLAGERPFAAGERERKADAGASAVPSRGGWDAVPAAIRGVLERALAPDPTARHADAGALADALAAAAAVPGAANDETILLPADPTADAPPAPGRPAKHPSLVRRGALAAALLAVVAIVALTWLLSRGEGAAAAPEGANATLEEAFLPLYGEAAERLAAP
jgi:eukaryotic-like serine/threonine-protein kinase